jgi:hypothetical protein
VNATWALISTTTLSLSATDSGTVCKGRAPSRASGPGFGQHRRSDPPVDQPGWASSRSSNALRSGARRRPRAAAAYPRRRRQQQRLLRAAQAVRQRDRGHPRRPRSRRRGRSPRRRRRDSSSRLVGIEPPTETAGS